MNYSVYDRISIDNKLATIRYIGTIPDWGDTIALGLEWDDITRGKNNGEINGIRYFTPQLANSGSFIKITNKKLIQAKSFIEIIQREYLDVEYIEAGIKFGSKKMEEFGWDKLNKFQGNLLNLKSITLDFQMINRSGYNRDVFDNLANLTNLELSFNLFNDFQEVWNIIDNLPNLIQLNLNGNRFFKYPETVRVHSLKVLKLCSTLISIDDLNQVVKKFPNLVELYISGNNYTNQEILQLQLPVNLQVLDISYNQLTTFPILLSQLYTINMSHNKIEFFPNTFQQLNLNSVDLRNNCINSYDFIDWLGLTLPSLQTLRINHQPLFQDIEEMTIQLISRLTNKLTKLNGSGLTKEEIENDELYFISKVQSGEYTISETGSGKWKYLLEKYNKSEVVVKPIVEQSDWIKLTINIPNQAPIPRLFLLSNSILQLKGIISKLYLQNIIN
ncbi:Protein PAC2 [Spathaspora sp. JA1]|nr:Protein PAC2 [Spathaspora sp. JA1]